MPCGGIYPVADVPTKYRCWECNKPGCDHAVEEWDSFLHERCVLAFLRTDEGQVVIEHKHLIQIGEVVLQEEGSSTYVDPDVCLAELRKAVSEMKTEMAKGFDGDLGDAAGATIAKFEALDAWLQRGGFLPTAWKVNR